jgi:hypothetical protein
LNGESIISVSWLEHDGCGDNRKLHSTSPVAGRGKIGDVVSLHVFFINKASLSIEVDPAFLSIQQKAEREWKAP